jgi:hypothetical protein
LPRLADFRAGTANALLALGSAALLLSACGAADNDRGSGGETVGEARALDEAAEMLDERHPARVASAEDGPGVDSAADDER